MGPLLGTAVPFLFFIQGNLERNLHGVKTDNPFLKVFILYDRGSNSNTIFVSIKYFKGRTKRREGETWRQSVRN